MSVDFYIAAVINIISILLLSKLIYFSQHRNKDYVFTFVVFNISIFLICSLLSNRDLGMGLAFGLFAIFSIIRYRTIAIPVREMGYFFVSVSLALINSFYHGWILLIVFNLVLLFVTYIMDIDRERLFENYKVIILNNTELIHMDKKDELLQHLNEITGQNFHNVSIERIDFLKNISKIKVYYYSEKNESKQIDNDDD